MSVTADPDRWVRVRDLDTGHQYDVRARSLRRGMAPLDSPRWPDLPASRQPREAKPLVGKDGGPPKPPEQSGARSEQHDGPPSPAGRARKPAHPTPAAPDTTMTSQE